MTHTLTKKITLVVFLLTAVFCTAKAQLTQSIRGTVTDQLLLKPLAGATVYLSSQNKRAVTDSNGNFRFTGVPVGLQSIHISSVGYNDAAVENIVVNTGKEVVLNIAVETKVVSLNNVSVSTSSKKNKPLNDMSVVSARAFTVEETQKYAAAVNDPLRMATNFAGVVGANDGNNDIIIRGNSPTGLLWRMEGIDIPNPNHFSSAGGSGGGISILSAQLLANSDFITGAFAAEYGNALSGVFDLKLRKGNNERREYTLEAGLLGLNLGFEGPFSKKYKGSYLVNYRYSTLSMLSKLGVEIGTASTVFQDLSYNIYLPTKKYGNFTVFGFTGLSSQDEEPEKNSAKWEDEGDRYGGKFTANTNTTGITHSIALGSNTNIKTAASYAYTKNSFNQLYAETDGSLSPSYVDNHVTQKYILSSTVNHRFNAKNSLRAGFIVNLINFDYYQRSRENIAAPLKDVISTKGNTQTVQAFAQWKHKMSNSLSATAGLHYLQLLYNNTNAIEPRASVKWDVNRKNSLSFGYGLHSQMQGLGVYFAQQQMADGSKTNPNKNLRLTQSHHFVFSYSRRLFSNLVLKTELYYQHLFNAPVSVYDSSTFSTLNILSEYVTDPLTNKGKGKNYGLEISLEKHLSNNMYYMFSNSFYQSKYKALDGIERNTRFNGNYVSNFIAGKDFISANQKRTFAINLKLVGAGGFRTTLVDFAQSQLKGYTVYKQKEAFTQQNPAYFRTDVKLSMKWNRKHFTSTLSLDIQNITNRQNVSDYYYDALRNEVRANYQAGLIPILAYRVQF